MDKAKKLEKLRAIPDDKLLDPKRDTTLKYIENPDPMLARLREQERARAREIPYNGCPHPISAIGQFFDDSGDRKRNARPTNLFECTVCHCLLSLVDYYGNMASDG